MVDKGKVKYPQLGKRLRRVRGKRSLQDMGTLLGCTRQFYHFCENGYQRPGLSTLQKWCDSLRVKPETIYPEIRWVVIRAKKDVEKRFLAEGMPTEAGGID